VSLAKLASFSPVRHGARAFRVTHASRRVSARAMLPGIRQSVHAWHDTPSRPKATIPVVTPYWCSEDVAIKIILDAAKQAGLNWGGTYGDHNHFDFDPSPRTARDALFKNFTEQVRVLHGSRMKEPL
jgi:hypothetical protein